jgi:hypothetical protein
MESEKKDLGDGVYFKMVGDTVRLTTTDGLKTTNAIYLERHAWKALKAAVREYESREGEGDGFVVHVLHFGGTPCGMVGFPNEWPGNHLWVAHNSQPELREQVTCPACLGATR